MILSLQTVIYRLEYDRRTSDRIGYLASQYRLAYNRAADILNRQPNIQLAGKYRDRGSSLMSRINAWRFKDGRASAPRAIHHAGAFDAYQENKLAQIQHDSQLRSPSTIMAHSGSDRHRRTLRHRSRKYDMAGLTSMVPPVRIDESSFSISGARDIILRTKDPVPQHLDIRGFRLVEVRSERRGVNGTLRKRRYALHLQVAVQRPAPPKHETITAPSDIVAVSPVLRGHSLVSTGEAICLDEAATGVKVRLKSAGVRGKKKRSRRRSKMQASIKKSKNRRRANCRRLLAEHTRNVLEASRPAGVAIEQRGTPTTGITIGRPLDRNKGGPTMMRHQLDVAIRRTTMSEEMQTVAEVAERLGIRLYRVLPEASQDSGIALDTRRRDSRDSQATHRCRRCGHELGQGPDSAHVLRERAYLMAGLAIGRIPTVECAPTGWRVRPSHDAWGSPCDSKGVAKPKSGEEPQRMGPPRFARGEYPLQGAALKAGSTEQDAQRQLMTNPKHEYVITFLDRLPVEIVAMLHLMVEDNRAHRTVKAYVQAMASWAAWAIANGRPVMPANSWHVGLYLALRVMEDGYGVSTMRLHAASIRHYHLMYGLPNPITDQVVRLLSGLHRMYGSAQAQAPGLMDEHLKVIREMEFPPKPGETEVDSERRRELVIALISTMRGGMLRPAEAATLTWADIESIDGDAGLVIVRQSKTDQFGMGEILYLPPITMRDLALIRGDAGPEDSVFDLSTMQVYLRIKNTIKLAGYGGSFSGHSPRRGMAIDLKRSGISMPELKQAGRWDSETMAAHYTRDDRIDLGPVAEYYRRRARNEGTAQSG